MNYLWYSISALSSEPKNLALAIDQTLTCTVSDLVEGQGAVDVFWRESAEGAVLGDADSDMYSIDEGTVTSDGTQVSILTIKVAKLETIDESSVTYKCSARSTQYPDSAESEQIDVVGNILTYGTITI